MSLRGNVLSLRKFSQDLRRLPKETAQKIAKASAPAITALGQKTFNAGQDAYGVPWAPSQTDGSRVTLRKSGKLAEFLSYVAIGTRLRVALGMPYAKYQVGKRPVFPTQDSALPAEYAQTLKRIAVDIVRKFRDAS